MSSDISEVNLTTWWNVIIQHADNENIAITQAYKHHIHGAPRSLLIGALMKKEGDEFIVKFKARHLEKTVAKHERRTVNLTKSIRHVSWSETSSLGTKLGLVNNRHLTSGDIENELKEMRATVEDWLMLQDAAWKWIASNIDSYDDQFEKHLRDPDMPKDALWEQVVIIRQSCIAAEEQIQHLEIQLEKLLGEAKAKPKKGILKKS